MHIKTCPAHGKPTRILPTPIYPAPKDPELSNLATLTAGHHISVLFSGECFGNKCLLCSKTV